MSNTPKNTVGFYARSGGEVLPYVRGKVVKRPIKDSLKVGQRVCVPSLFGYADAKVTEIGNHGDNCATARSGQAIFPLRFSNDDRNCWTCSLCIDDRVVKGLLF